MQRRLVRVAVDAGPRRPGSTPHSPRDERLAAPRTRRPSAGAGCRLPGGVHPVVERPSRSRWRCSAGRRRSGRTASVTSSFVSIRRSPFVSRISQTFGGSATSTPRSSTFSDARENEAIGKDGALVHPAVAVRVFQHDDAADRIVLVRSADRSRHEARHLDGPQPSLQDPSRARPGPGSAARSRPARGDNPAACRTSSARLPGTAPAIRAETVCTPGGHGRFAGERC